MHMKVDQSWANHQALGIDAFHILRGLSGGVRTQRSNFSVVQKQIGNGVELIGWIDDSAAGEQQRFHAGSISGGEGGSSCMWPWGGNHMMVLQRVCLQF